MSDRYSEGRLRGRITWYVCLMFALISFFLGTLVGGFAICARSGLGERSMISEQEAIDRAEEWLAQSGIETAERQISVQHTDVYVVSFLPPEGWLAGELTVRIDASTGEVLHATFELN
jgi:hypothetical protein